MTLRPTPERLSETKALGLAIKRLRKRADLTQEQAAEALGVVVQSWRRYEWGERGLPLHKLGDIANVLGVTRDALIQESQIVGGPPPTERTLALADSPAERASLGRHASEFSPIPVRERIQAGAWLTIDDDSTSPTRSHYPAGPDPRYARSDQWLSEVVGDGANGLSILDGDLVHLVDAIDINYSPRTGDIVEVERSRFGRSEIELTIKEIEVTPEGVRLWPRSTNPRHRDPIVLTSGHLAGDEVQVRISALVLAAIRRF
jgi:transcriptional regulator with XRE-family HTH domain